MVYIVSLVTLEHLQIVIWRQQRRKIELWQRLEFMFQDSFNDLPATIKEVYESLNLEPIPEPEINKIPSYRRPKQFICTISD